MIARKKKPSCPVEAYARAVLSAPGSEEHIIAGRLVRLAAERHLRDLVDGRERGLRWDQDACDDALQFFGFLRLPEGEQAFVLQPWQQFIVGSLFGWMGADGHRRFRTAYIEGGKGSGKTPLAAGIGLKGLVADGESAAEIYTAGVTRDQGAYLLNDATKLVGASSALKKLVDVGAHNLAVLETNSYMRAVSSEGRTLDQKRVHMALIDEVHEHRESVVVDKMRAGTKGRKQALIFIITNSGHDRRTVCWRMREYSEKVLKGIVQDDSWFAYVCTLDPCAKCESEGKTQPVDGCKECDDWRDEKTWIKANPNLGVSLPKKYLEEQVREAVGMPAKENIVKRLNFCIWTEQADRIIPMNLWDACGDAAPISTFKDRQCFGGLDIGATSDFCAFDLIFPHDDTEQIEEWVDPLDEKQGKRIVMRRSFSCYTWLWLPERPIKRDESTQASIDLWAKQGFVKLTSGDSVDYDVVLDDILRFTKPYNVCGIGFDRGFQGGQMGTNLMKHFGEEIVEYIPQGIFSMGGPFREFMELLKTGRLHHDGNPVMRWMASNTAGEERNGMVKPSKDKSAEKIDGVVARTMALAMGTKAKEFSSIYSTAGELAL